MVIYKIRKRNGAIVTFEKDKIHHAIKSAFEATGSEDLSPVEKLTDLVLVEIEKKI